MTGVFHGGAIGAAAATYGGPPSDWLDLSTGINPNPPVLPDIPTAVWNRLPDTALELSARREALKWYVPNRIEQAVTGGTLPLPVPGTQAFIQQLPRLVPAGRRVAILSPTYGEYAHGFARAGFGVDAIQSPDGLTPDHGTLVIVNPNNPDGRIFTRSELEELQQRMGAQAGHLHVDEAFGDARPDLSMAAFASANDNLSVSRSFGKFFGMAGVRLGFVFGAEPFLARLSAALGPWATPGPALFIAARMMAAETGLTLARMQERKAALDRILAAYGLAIAGGTELFTLVRDETAPALFEHLARSHILVRRFDYADNWLRIGLTPDQQGDRRLAQALASARD